ncbi:MAG: Pr6Pr family membrane protein [Clostridium sp.]|jgi:hypothetical protein|nr:Pr6Pr family membrane protein [Clostridium sp.]
MIRRSQNNRIFAVCYRSAAFLLCLAGILDIVGVFRGEVSLESFLYYTTESNLLVLFTLGLLLAKTAADLAKNGAVGRASYFERFSAIVSLAILVTFFVFWGMLAPIYEGGLFTYSNLQIHAVTPLMMVFDHFFFGVPGKMKKQDPLLFAIFPFGYFLQSTVAGLLGMTYSHTGSSAIKHYPYFFLDFEISKGWVALYVGLLTVFFLGLAYLLLWLDGKRAKRADRRLSPI